MAHHAGLPQSYAAKLTLSPKNTPGKTKHFKAFLAALKRKPPRKLDDLFHHLHQQAFEQIDCLQCANCCKTTSPIFYDKDIERLARHLRLRPAQVIEQYLKVDEEGDWVLKQSPCLFLSADNHCSVYEARPTACREYPHTNRKRMHQILDLTFYNTLVCPAVADIIHSLKKACYFTKISFNLFTSLVNKLKLITAGGF